MKYLFGLTLILMLCTAGCTLQNSPVQKPQTRQQQSLNKAVPAEVELAGRAGDKARTVDAVKDSTAVVLGKEISVAVRVTGFDRLKLKTIRRNVHEKISQMAPGYQVHVTTDKKIFSELEKLQSRIQRGEAPDRLKAELDKINKNMRG